MKLNLGKAPEHLKENITNLKFLWHHLTV